MCVLKRNELKPDVEIKPDVEQDGNVSTLLDELPDEEYLSDLMRSQDLQEVWIDLISPTKEKNNKDGTEYVFKEISKNDVEWSRSFINVYFLMYSLMNICYLEKIPFGPSIGLLENRFAVILPRNISENLKPSVRRINSIK